MDQSRIKPEAGVILIAHPWLPDPNFARTVVLLCEHDEKEGSFGLVLVRRLDRTIGEVVETLSGAEHDLYLGGPVQPDTLHYLHGRGDVVDDAIQIQEGLFWGGDFDMIQAMVLAGELEPDSARFFAGYSGWGPGQLDAEIEEGSWILTRAPSDVMLETADAELWRVLLRRMGGPFSILSNFPVDPRQN